MLSLYADRKPSLAVLRRFAPYKYLVIPDIELHVKKDPSDQSYLIKRYPGEIRRLEFKCNARAIEALRRLYKSGDLNWRIKRGEGETIFFHPGQVIRKVDAVDYSAPSVAE
jgi:hypothetical protein